MLYICMCIYVIIRKENHSKPPMRVRIMRVNSKNEISFGGISEGIKHEMV